MTVALQTQGRRTAFAVAEVVPYAIDVLYVGRDRTVIEAIEAAGYGVDHATTFEAADRMITARWYRVVAAEVDDTLARWLVDMHEDHVLHVPLVIRDGFEVVSLLPRRDPKEHRGMELPSVVAQVLANLYH